MPPTSSSSPRRRCSSLFGLWALRTLYAVGRAGVGAFQCRGMSGIGIGGIKGTRGGGQMEQQYCHHQHHRALSPAVLSASLWSTSSSSPLVLHLPSFSSSCSPRPPPWRVAALFRHSGRSLVLVRSAGGGGHGHADSERRKEDEEKEGLLGSVDKAGADLAALELDHDMFKESSKTRRRELREANRRAKEREMKCKEKRLRNSGHSSSSGNAHNEKGKERAALQRQAGPPTATNEEEALLQAKVYRKV
ncbi:hypothetical protein VYU27_008233 [Nannochloropsis oceanica]